MFSSFSRRPWSAMLVTVAVCSCQPMAVASPGAGPLGCVLERSDVSDGRMPGPALPPRTLQQPEA